MSDEPKQKPLPGFDYIGRAARISNRASKERRRVSLPKYQPSLRIPDENVFPAEGGVPSSRASCPEGYCNRIRCRSHLAMVDAEHRAGRPGLSHVARDERGWTQSVAGDVGDERAGTTFNPRWLRLEQTCRMNVYWNADGRVDELEPVVTVNAEGKPIHLFRKWWVGSWETMRERLHVGERLEVYDENEKRIGNAYWMPDDSIGFDVNIYATAVYLVRPRPVSSCALNCIKQAGRAMTNSEVGDVLGRHRTLIARETKRALEKAKRIAAELGMSEADLLRGLRELGAERS